LIFQDRVKLILDELVKLVRKGCFVLLSEYLDCLEKKFKRLIEQGAEVNTVLCGKGIFLHYPKLSFS